MRPISQSLPLIGAAALAMSLAGCVSLPIPPQGETDADPEKTSAVAEDAQRAYYDNVVLFFEFADSVLGESTGLLGAPTVRGTWDEVDQAARDEQVEAGLGACAQLEEPTPDAETGVLMPWLASRFLCEDHRAAADSALSAEYGDDALTVLDASLLKGDAAAADVFRAVEYCEVAIETFYTLSADFTPGYFCWIMRANVNAGKEDENDFLFLFLHTDDEQEAADAEFDRWAREMGATPNFLGSLSDQPR